MIRKNSGFTIVELMITMVIFVIAIAAASNIFTGLLTQFKQQSSIAESNIQGIPGLEMLRFDIEQAGFGLPWNMNGLSYDEAVDAWHYDGTHLASVYNDDNSGTNSNPPRAVVAGDGVVTFNPGASVGSDVLVIKATNIATNKAAYRWTYMVNSGGTTSNPVQWPPENDRLANGDCVEVMTGTSRKLGSGGAFYTDFHTAAASWPDALKPSNNTFNLIYGIKKDCATQAPRMPFNRADYYVKVPSSNMPKRCAPGTGILYKGTIINNASGTDAGKLDEMPVLDCVADMQVVLAADTNNDGTPDAYYTSGWPANTTAQDVRNQLEEVRVYLVVQEGQKDPTYTYKSPTITVNDPDAGDLNTLTLASMGADAIHYRWRVYTLVIQPYNLR